MGILIGVAFASGMIFSTVCMTVAWFIDAIHLEGKHKENRIASYRNGFRNGAKWRDEQVKTAEEEIAKLREEIDTLLNKKKIIIEGR